MSYTQKIKNHLSEYKIDTLNIKEPGIYLHKGRTYKYKYILPAPQYRDLNILDRYRKHFFDSKHAKNIKFHRYFHHLNSSQALCINLFYPLIKENTTGAILQQLKLREQTVTLEEFEKTSDLEKDKEGKNRRKTNFDFFMQLEDGTKIYFEIKYTEDGFGKVDPNQMKNKSKFSAVYERLLNKKFIQAEYHDCTKFLENYQIMRNLCHITEKGYINDLRVDNSHVVFVYPEANKKIHHQVEMAQKEILTDEGNKRFRALTLETLIPFLISEFSGTPLGQYYNDFDNKYRISNVNPSKLV